MNSVDRPWVMDSRRKMESLWILFAVASHLMSFFLFFGTRESKLRIEFEEFDDFDFIFYADDTTALCCRMMFLYLRICFYKTLSVMNTIDVGFWFSKLKIADCTSFTFILLNFSSSTAHVHQQRKHSQFLVLIFYGYFSLLFFLFYLLSSPTDQWS